MLFNSYSFLLCFLPICLAGYFILARQGKELATVWLASASLFFYGWWNPAYVGLLFGSISFNYGVGYVLTKVRPRGRRNVLIAAIALNLALLAYYKYVNFFLNNVIELVDASWGIGEIILPLGISFFTFTQIAFLVDAYRGEVREYNFLHYLLFVTYFPHLIAGPILHHKEMMPQFASPRSRIFRPRNTAVGITVFTIGLVKKVIIADGIGQYAAPVFSAASQGLPLGFFDAWGGALAYTLQLYFDFSGYSDMAIGLSLLFGIRLPINFASPYKATSIIEFWRRWHITLSRFLRDYLYFPLGGSRKGPLRRYVNLMATMLLGGLWHGAGWTFVVWGGLHGVYLVINHAWRSFRSVLPWQGRSWLERELAWGVTFIAVVVAWVLFRSTDMESARRMLLAMAGQTEFGLPESWMGQFGAFAHVLSAFGVQGAILPAAAGIKAYVWILPLLALVRFAPNTQEIMAVFRPALEKTEPYATHIVWRPSTAWAIGGGLALTVAALSISRTSEFLYFQF